jgi:alkyl hydroperoxide reductase subunit AhpC
VKCSVYYRINTPRRQGGLGPIRIPLLSDLNHQISKDYGVYLEDSGHTLRYPSVVNILKTPKTFIILLEIGVA